MKKKVCLLILISISSLIICGAVTFFARRDRVVPSLDSFDNVELVFTDWDNSAFHLVYSDGEISEPYAIHVNVISDTGRHVFIKHGAWSMFTWSPGGEYLAFTTNIYYQRGFPALLSSEGEIFTCMGENLPITEDRVWVVDEMRVISANIPIGDEHDSIVIYNFSTCEIEETLYTAREDEWLYEATLSSLGWLAISMSTPDGVSIKIIDPVGNEFVIPGGKTPSWSMDGERLAYVIHEDGLYYSDKTGQNHILIQEGIRSDTGYPSWSPSREWIAYGDCCTITGSRLIYKINIYTSEKVLISDYGSYPCWRWGNNE